MKMGRKTVLILFVGLATMALAMIIHHVGSSSVNASKDGQYGSGAVVDQQAIARDAPRNTTNGTTKETEMNMTNEDKASNRPPGLTKEEEAILQTGLVSPEKSLVIGQICLKHRLSKHQVIALLGKPQVMDGTRATYNLAPSQWLDIHFDATGNVVRVEMSGKPISP